MDPQITKKVDSFFKQFKHQIFKKGEILIRADENPLGIFYLTRGTVKQYTISHKGDELLLNIYKSQTFFPMSWAINHTPNHYYFEALGEIELWRAPKEETVTFIKNNPDVLLDLISRLYKGTDGLLSRMVSLMSGEAYIRVLTELLINAKRFGRLVNNTIQLTLSEKDIASQSGMARETVSREIKRLKDKELVKFFKNKLIITDLKGLEQELVSD